MAKVKQTVVINSQKKLLEDVFCMWLHCPEIVKEAHGGQFLSLYSADGAKLLPRPISICEIDREEEHVSLYLCLAGS